MSTESVMPSNHLIFCWPLLLLPSIFPNIRVFSNESALHIRWPKYWRFSFSLCPSKALISFRIDWFDLLAVQGTLKPSPALQHSQSSVRGFPGGVSGNGSASQCRIHKTHGFDSWVGKIPWEKGMATHSNILAWRIPWTVEPGEIPSIGSQRV